MKAHKAMFYILFFMVRNLSIISSGRVNPVLLITWGSVSFINGLNCNSSPIVNLPVVCSWDLQYSANSLLLHYSILFVKISHLTWVFMARINLSFLGQFSQHLIERVVHFFTCTLEKSTTATYKESITSKDSFLVSFLLSCTK